MSGGDWKEMFRAATEGDLRLVEYHVQNAVDVNYVHPEILGTALVASIMAKQEAVALFLLENGADPNLVSEFEGLTPLQATRQSGLGNVEAKLLSLGAEDTAAETDPVTPPAPTSWLSRLWKRLG